MILILRLLVIGMLSIFLGHYAFGSDINKQRQSSSVGTGLQGLADWSSQYPFLDTMKLSRVWFDWERRTAEGIQVNGKGWVTSFDKGLRPETVFLTTDLSRPVIYKHYIVRWQGKGRLGYGGCAEKVGRAHGGDRIKVKHHECTMALEEIDESDPIRNITIVPEKHIDAFDRGEIFNPDFIEKIGVFRSVRFMDWMVTNGSVQSRWTERPLPDDRSYAKKGVPLELMIALANKLSADPWFNMPHLADVDYFRNFAYLVKEQLNPGLTTYVEHSNEIWNWLFPQSQYALKVSKVMFNAEGDAYQQWHGMRTAQMCDVWKGEVFAGERQRVVCILGAQVNWPGLEQAALDCPLWAKGNKPCIEHSIDAIAVAAYFSGCLSGIGNPEFEQKIIAWNRLGEQGMVKAYEQVKDGRHFECEDTLPEVMRNYEYHVREAKKRGLKVLAYEGGQHITSNFSQMQGNEDFVGLHVGINKSPLIKNLYKINFENWRKAGGGLFMHFVDTSDYTQHGSWGALEYITQDTSPKWEALIEFNQTPCWWENCR
jgi:hypothetical protein